MTCTVDQACYDFLVWAPTADKHNQYLLLHDHEGVRVWTKVLGTEDGSREGPVVLSKCSSLYAPHGTIPSWEETVDTVTNIERLVLCPLSSSLNDVASFSQLAQYVNRLGNTQTLAVQLTGKVVDSVCGILCCGLVGEECIHVLAKNTTPTSPGSKIVRITKETIITLDDKARQVNTAPPPSVQPAGICQAEVRNKICSLFPGFVGVIESLVSLIGDSMDTTLAISSSGGGSLLVPAGVILHGPSGCGKSHLARSLAVTLGEGVPGSDFHTYSINCAEAFKTDEGDTEEYLRGIFEEAILNAPSVIVLDCLESISSCRSGAQAAERRALNLLNDLLDRVARCNSFVFVVGLTINLQDIHASTRLPGRLSIDLKLEAPNPAGRGAILSHLVSGVQDKIGLVEYLVENTQGYNPSDLCSLVRQAVLVKAKSGPGQDKGLERGHFEVVLSRSDSSAPSALRKMNLLPQHGPVDASQVLYGIDNIIDHVNRSCVWQFTRKDIFREMGIKAANGVLIYGPPGCGKTTLAHTIARKAKANFISVDGPDVISMVVGESEARIRALFEQARRSRPAILFFDQIDAIAPRRGNDSTSEMTFDRFLSCLLMEIDGVCSGGEDDGRGGLLVLAATARPDLLDPAILRPGRLDEHICVPLPTLSARISILSAKLQSCCVEGAETVAVDLAGRCEGFSGADLTNLVREASIRALREDIHAKAVCRSHLIKALTALKAG